MMKRLIFGLGLMAIGWIGSQFTGGSSSSLAARPGETTPS